MKKSVGAGKATMSAFVCRKGINIMPSQDVIPEVDDGIYQMTAIEQSKAMPDLQHLQLDTTVVGADLRQNEQEFAKLEVTKELLDEELTVSAQETTEFDFKETKMNEIKAEI